MSPRHLMAVAVCLAFLPCASPVWAENLLGTPNRVMLFREDAARSQVIVFGRLENPRGGPEKGSVDLVITKVLRNHPALAGRKVIRVAEYLPIPDPRDPPQHLALGEVIDGRPTFVLGLRGTRALAAYAEGILAIGDKDRVKLLRHCFDHLDHADPAITYDAFTEFRVSTDDDIRKVGRTLSPGTLRRRIRDDGTPLEQLGLYAFLLGNCGEREDAALVRALLDKFLKKERRPSVACLLTGYALLGPRDGWKYTCDLLKDPGRNYLVRREGLRAVQYLQTTHPEIATEKEMLAAFRSLVRQRDIADFAIEHLRRAKCWKLTEEVLALSSDPAFDIPAIQRSVCRYALQCPDARSAGYIAELRRKDPSLVRDMEESVKLEAMIGP